MLWWVDQEDPNWEGFGVVNSGPKRLFRGVYRADSADSVLTYVACLGYGPNGFSAHELGEIVDVDDAAIVRAQETQCRRREQRAEAAKRRRVAELGDQLSKAQLQVDRLREELAKTDLPAPEADMTAPAPKPPQADRSSIGSCASSEPPLDAEPALPSPPLV